MTMDVTGCRLAPRVALHVVTLSESMPRKPRNGAEIGAVRVMLPHLDSNQEPSD